MICTAAYRKKIEDHDAEPQKGKGVRWEANFIRNYLYDGGTQNPRFLPVLLNHDDAQCIPMIMNGYSRYYVKVPYHVCDGYSDLICRLTGQNRTPKPPIGPQPCMVSNENRHDESCHDDADRRLDHEFYLPTGSDAANLKITVPADVVSLGDMASGKDSEPISGKRVSFVPAMLKWTCDPKDSPFAVLLGEYGMGKTWNSQSFWLWNWKNNCKLPKPR